ncbi:MAG TPA: hypothetical protein VFE46_11795 [Pirellulales bacterium]|jgi:hypothetical protein|nr:hypothetical protein [Pirellulales bacterium]
MDASRGISWAYLAQPVSALLPSAKHYAAWALSIFLVCVTVYLLARRCAGALIAPLPAQTLIGVGISLASVAYTALMLCQADGVMRLLFRWSAAPELMIIAALPLFALAITVPGSAWYSVAIMWISVCSAEIGLWQARRSRWSDKVPSLSRPQLRAPFATPFIINLDPITATQKLVHHRLSDGTAKIEGWVRIDFADGQRTGITHVAFCPAFRQTPYVEVDVGDGPSCEIRTTLVVPWGVRWELKLDAIATQPVTTILEFIACEANNSNEDVKALSP